MKKHYFNVIAALALVCGVFAFSGCADYETDINNLNDRVDALETGRIADVEDQLASLQEALASAESAIDAIEALDLEGLKNTVADQGTTIDGLESEIDGLKSEIDGLTSGLSDLEGTVNDIRDGLSDYATLDYVDATFATKTAVAELETRLGTLEGDLESLQNDLNMLESRVGKIEGLYDSELKISEIISKIDQAQADASEALGKVNSLIDALGVYAEAGQLQAALDSKLDIADFDAKFEEALQAALNQGGMIDEAIASAINEIVDQFNALFSQRLTSVSLIPSAYLDGVPAIKFNAYAYNIKTINNAQETVTAGSIFRVAGAATDVQYHVSPSNLTNEDIITPEYLIQEAEILTRAASDIELNVLDYSLENDVLTVSVERGDANISLNPDDESYIYTAALKVPIAEKNLVEGEEEANVYSEYSALYESEVTPYIAAVIDDSRNQKDYSCTRSVNHFYATYAEAATATSAIAANSAYNEPIDLLAMVTGCEGNPSVDGDVHKEITKATLRANGLTFRFAVPTKKFELGTNNTDQQTFAVVDGNELRSTYVGDESEGSMPNEASIDKTPVVRVMLVDTVNKDQIVDVRYFKVKWTPVPVVIDDQDLGVVEEFEYTLGCDDFTESINWDTFVQKILSKVNGGTGISYKDFVKTYNSSNATYRVDYKVEAGHDDVFAIYWDNAGSYDEHAAAFTWDIHPVEFGSLIDGKNVADLNKGDVIKTFSITITLPSNDDYNGDIIFKVTVDVKVPELPSIVGYNTIDWLEMGELARIRPVQFGSESAETYVTYNYDMTTLFRMNNSGVFMNGVVPPATSNQALACRAWSLQFAKDQVTDYEPEFNVAGRPTALYAGENDAFTGYRLFWRLERAAYMVYNGEESASENWHQDAHEDIALRLEGTTWPEVGNGHYRGTDAAINLLESIFVDGTFDYQNDPAEYQNRVTINAWGRINPWNHVIVKTFDVVFVKPVYVLQSDEEQFFEDGYEGGRSINVEDLFQAKDSWTYPVSVYATGTDREADARKVYYDVQDPKFDLTNARIGLELENGNYVPVDNPTELSDTQIEGLIRLSEFDVNASVTESDVDGDDYNELVFRSERGWNLEQVVYLFVEVSIDHKWGTESMWVRIPVYPHGEAPVTE